MTVNAPTPQTGRVNPDQPGTAGSHGMAPARHDPHAESRLEHRVAALKPKLRGWLHFSAAPLALILGLGLMVVTPTAGLRIAVAVYVLTTVLLFGVSAAYHLGAGSPRVNAFLRKLDHANIYLFIAGSYTPFAAALPSTTLRWTILALVWGIALVGLIVRVAWTGAPRWLVTGSYIGLGWVALFYLPALNSAFGLATVSLLALGGLLYTVGGVIYARKRPNPHPEWFGFHELFHSFTIAAYLVQYAAVAMAVLS
ncbi:MAG: hemolysin III family protein [Candidatus Nanopelagicales bacterium]